MITILAAAVLSAGITGIAVPAATAAPAAPALCVDGCNAPEPGGPGDSDAPPTGGTPTNPAPTTPTTTTCSAPDVSSYSETTSYTPDCGTGFRLHASTYLVRFSPASQGPFWSARVQSYSRFEKSSNGDRVDVDYLRVACHDDYGGNDSDHEHDASKTTVTYSTPLAAPGARVIVTCEHQATYRGVNYSATTVTTYYMPSRPANS